MVTLQDINQFAVSHKIGSNTDIFSLLSMMKLEARKAEAVNPSPTALKVEYTTQDLLDLFST